MNDNTARVARAVTIRDVAARAGVSLQTVSRAINNKAEIDPETRRRVLQVAGELGYRPSSIARGLKTRHTRTIGLVVPDIANPFFAEVARGAAEVAHGRGHGVFLCNTDEHAEREADILRMLAAQRVEGLVLVSSRLDDAQLSAATESWRPVVVVNRTQPARAGLGCVVTNEAQAAVEATSHLIARGHRGIAYLSGSGTSRSSLERRRGYSQAMRAAGLGVRPDWHVTCAPTVDGGRQAALTLLRDCPDVTAVLAYNDLVAVGALQACRTLGRVVPRDCALVGWDDIVFAAYVSPALTTVHMPKYQIGERAMALLFDLIDSPGEAPEVATLHAALIVRESA